MHRGSKPKAPTVLSDPASAQPRGIWERIKAHKVAQWTLAYAAAAYTLLHGYQMVGESFEWPHIASRIVTVVLFLGVPIVATFAWFHGHRGRQRVGGIELIILTILLTAAGSVLWYIAHSHHEDPAHSAAPTLVEAPPAAFKPPEHSIAVLPFADMSEKKDQEYFADGMAEEILNLLVTIPDLKVTGRTSSFQFKGKSEDLRTIGSTLGTAYVVEGSVRRSGDHVRVTAQLIDTRTGTHRWSQAYDRDVKDALQVQGEIAAGLVRALQVEVAPSILAKVRNSPPSPAAYDLYLRGLHAANRYDQSGFEEAVIHFRHALEIDPTFVPASEQLASNLENMTSWGFIPVRQGFELTRAAVHATLKLDSKSARAHALLGEVCLIYDWNWPAAKREHAIALALAPGDPFVLYSAGMERLALGHSNEALQFLRTALAADPLNADLLWQTSSVYLRLGRLSDAERSSRRVLEISPTYAWGHMGLGIVRLTQGEAADALVEALKEDDAGARLFGLAVIYHALHRKKDADAALAGLEALHAGTLPMLIAEAHAVRGENNLAFEWLEKAYQQKDFNLYRVKEEPLLKGLETDPRFKAFLGKMRLTE